MNLDEKQKNTVDNIMASNRKERRKLGKMLKVKIPGSNRPILSNTKNGPHTH